MLPWRAALFVVLLAALVVASVAVVVPAASLWERRAATADRERLTEVAVEVAVLLSSLSVDDAETSLDRLAELSTGGLREEVASRRAEVLRTLDDDEVRTRAEVIAVGVEQDVSPRGILDRSGAPARASLLVATRAEVRNAQTTAQASAAGPGRDDDVGERTWRWRLRTVIEGDTGLVESAEVAV